MHDPGTDPLSSLARQIMGLDVASAYSALVPSSGPTAEARRLLEGLTPEQLFTNPAKNVAASYAVLAGLWLWHDGLEECHRIVQQSPDAVGRAASRGRSLETFAPRVSAAGDLELMTATFALWHAIMHRREGDFSNSKYWFARCQKHPTYAPLAVEVNSLLGNEPADKSFLRLTINGWDPDAFVDLVEAVNEKPGDPRRSAVLRVQQAEWRQVFNFCLRAAME